MSVNEVYLKKENIAKDWLRKAEKRSVEKFGFNIIGVDLEKLKEAVDEEVRLRIRK